MLDARERALATVDLAAVRHNVRRLVKALRRPAVLCAVVKANGYGHGAVPAARAALEGGATWLGVATATEAEELRGEGIDAPVLVFGPLTGDELRRATLAHAEVVVWSEAFLREALRLGARVHVKFDSGMGRLGVDAAAAEALCASSAAASSLVGLMSHFATADEEDDAFFRGQLERFATVAAELRKRHTKLLCHVANSAATLREPQSHFDLVRTGIAVYGLSPFHDDPAKHDLRPALRLTSYLAGVRDVAAGDSVGYGRTFVAEGPARVGIVPIGYGDGVARALSNRGDALVCGRRCRIGGTISMDQLTVVLPDDVGRPGDEVVFIGESGDERVLAEDVARLLGTVSNEIACDVGTRVLRRYTGGVTLV